ncbi:MAG: CapA family protein [Bacteroidales bacterium]
MRMVFPSFVGFLLLSSSLVCGQEQEKVSEDSVILLFAGDVMGHMPQVHAAFDFNTLSYSFASCFRFIQPILDSVDIAVANLESTLAGPPYSGYPLFSTPDALARDLFAAGFDILATANNHCYDKGKYGMERTIRVLDSLKIPHMGTYANAQARDTLFPLIICKKGVKIALFNYTYGTNGISVDTPNIVNMIDRRQIRRDLQRADSLKVDVKVIFLHWGREYELKPNSEQVSLARFLVQAGADIVVGSHPHVVQTFEEIQDTVRKRAVPVFYSLGNFISNQRDPNRDGGAMALFIIRWRTLSDSARVFEIKSQYCPFWVYKGTLEGRYQYYVLPLPNGRNIPLPPEDRQRMEAYFEHVRMQLHNLPMKVFALPQ